MTVRKGWEAEITLSKIGSEGPPTEYGIVKEVLASSLGTDVQGGVAYTAVYPVVDFSGDVITSNNQVEVYHNGTLSPPASGEYTISGTNGRVELAAPNQWTGEKLEISYNYKRTVGYAQGLSWEVSAASDPVTVIGQKDPKEVVPGRAEITGTVDEFFVDRRLFQQADKAVQGQLVEFDMDVVDNPDAANPIYVKFEKVKFGTWNYDMSADGFTANNTDFTARNMLISQ